SHRAAGRTIPDVQRKMVRLPAGLADVRSRCGRRVAIDVERNDLRAFAGIGEGDGAADSGTCACDDSGMAVQKSGHCSLPSRARKIAVTDARCYIGEEGASPMCRNIKTLFNFEPPATEDEIRASSLQFVRKLSGFNKPSQANAAAFELAVEEVSQAARKLLASLHTAAPARDREIEVEKARARARARFA